jgi:plasmid stabilization system protein ParE
MKKYKVYLSPVAERKLDLLLDYLLTEWGFSSKTKFLHKFKKVIEQISNHPYSFIESFEMKGIYKCIITKQTSFYYRILNDEVEIITFLDNRQDQKSTFEEIKKHFI